MYANNEEHIKTPAYVGVFYVVPEEGLEPSILSAQHFKCRVYTSSTTRATMEVVMGFAPMNSGFADRRVRLLHHTTIYA